MPSMRQLTSVLAVLSAFAPVPAAHARVVVVASGDGAATLTDVTTNKVVARIARGRALARRRRGPRRHPRLRRGRAARRRHRPRHAARSWPASTRAARSRALAASDDGQRLYASRRGAIDVIDAPTMTVRASIALGAKASGAALAISSDATRAVVVLDAKRVGVVDLVRFRLSRRVTLAGATGAAFAPTGPNAYVATSGRGGSRLIRLNTETGAVTRKIRLGKGLGGGVALTTDGRRAIVGAARGAAVTAVVPLRAGKLLRVHTGRGPGVPGGLARRHAHLRRRRRRRHRLGPQRAVVQAPDRAAPRRAQAARRPRGAARASRSSPAPRATTCSRARAAWTASTRSAATTSSPAGATTTCSSAAPATTCSAAAPATTSSTAATATTACSARPATTSSSAAWATTTPTAAPATTRSTAATATTRSTAATATTPSSAAPATTASRSSASATTSSSTAGPATTTSTATAARTRSRATTATTRSSAARARR